MSNDSETFFVKSSKHEQQLIKCSLEDYLVLKTPVSMAFLYRTHISKELIIKSLENVLCDYPIFGGVLIQKNNELFIDCNNQGVRVTVVNSDSSLYDSLVDLHTFDSEKFVDVIPRYSSSKKNIPVLTIKLNYYNDGMAIGYSWSHSVGDMRTFMEFLKALSNFAKGKKYKKALIPKDRSTYLAEWIKNQHIELTRKEDHKFKILNLFDILRILKQIYSSKENIYLYFTEKEILSLTKTLHDKSGIPLSKNEALCAYLLDFIARSRNDAKGDFYISLIVNMRSRLKMPSNLLGNYIDLMSVKIDNPQEVAATAFKIHTSLKNYVQEFFQLNGIEEFLSQKGMFKKIDRIVAEKMLPHFKNLTISNWSNFGAYAIDFGIQAPYLVLPVGRSLLPWVSCIMEGFDNRGLLVSLILPSPVAKKFKSMLDEIHQYRHSNESIYGL